MRRLLRGTPLAALVLLLTAATKPVPEVVQGVFALPGQAPKVAATLYATPSGSPSNGSGPTVPMLLGVTMTEIGAKKPVQHYDTELTKDLHLIAIGRDLRSFVHVHGEAPDKRGRITVPIVFPHSGFYWVFADAVPSGLGQQVFRFDLRAGTSRGASAPPAEAALPPPSLEAADGAYAVRLDPFTLTAGQEAQLRLHILHDGQPAADVTPYLGVAAHAVLISVSDLSYTHVHAMPAGAVRADPAPGDPMAGMAGGPAMTGQVPPDLALHIEPPKPGTYRLWLQFMAGGGVRTVAFTVLVQ